jgi:23S rRNA-intervening sequence protein
MQSQSGRKAVSGKHKAVSGGQKAYALAMEIFRISSKLTNADGENGETETWLDFAKDCGYLAPGDWAKLADECRQVGAILGGMLNDPSPFLLPGCR